MDVSFSESLLELDPAQMTLTSKRLPWWLRQYVWNAGDLGSFAGAVRLPWRRNGDPLQYSCLENPMDRGAGRLQPTGSWRVRRNWATKHAHTQVHLSLHREASFNQCRLPLSHAIKAHLLWHYHNFPEIHLLMFSFCEFFEMWVTGIYKKGQSYK